MSEEILAFSATVVGYNHIKKEKVCEDASGNYSDEKMKICVVADGHGSDNYPRTYRGSKFAVDAVINCIKVFVNTPASVDVIKDEDNNYEMMIGLTTSILNEWHYKVEKDYEKKPFTEAELEMVSDKYKQIYLNGEGVEKAYGCTLIAYVVTDKYSLGLQIGDGKCVCVDKKGDFSEPIPWDDDCQMNVTTSICDENAIEEFRFTISNQMPLAVFCGTDGIDDSYISSEELYALYRSILKIIIKHGDEVGKKEIETYLPELTKRGSGDDVSIGLIIDRERTKNIESIFDKQAELFELVSGLKEQNHQMSIIEAEKKINEIKEDISKSQFDIEMNSVDDLASLIENEEEYIGVSFEV